MKGSKLIYKSHKVRMLAILLSIFLHLIFVWFMGKTPSLAFPDLLPEPPLKELEKKYDRMAFELIETPAGVADELTDAETNLASDQSSKARDNYEGSELAEGMPYSEGYSDVKNYPNIIPPIPEEPVEEAQEEAIEPEKSFLAAFKKQQKEFNLKDAMAMEPAYDNQESSAQDMGGFSFNTYNWDFAPYMLRMKKRIRSNMNLPYAFTNLGAVSGDIMVRFEVLPSGDVDKLEVLSSDAHYSLEDSSVNAVRNSSAFSPLPIDFPEDRLVVTARFSFSIIKDK